MDELIQPLKYDLKHDTHLFQLEVNKNQSVDTNRIWVNISHSSYKRFYIEEIGGQVIRS